MRCWSFSFSILLFRPEKSNYFFSLRNLFPVLYPQRITTISFVLLLTARFRGDGLLFRYVVFDEESLFLPLLKNYLHYRSPLFNFHASVINYLLILHLFILLSPERCCYSSTAFLFIVIPHFPQFSVLPLSTVPRPCTFSCLSSPRPLSLRPPVCAGKSVKNGNKSWVHLTGRARRADP